MDKSSSENMKVIALGGCGGMGRYAVKTALQYDFIKEIIIADLDEKRAQVFAEECGPKVSFQQIDVRNRSALRTLFSGAAGVGGGMGGATGIPLAIGLKLLSSGKIQGEGVFTPEQVIDPDDFFNELAPLCTIPSATANAEEMLIITSS